MAKRVDSLDGFTLKDLMQKDGTILEIGDEYGETEDEEFSYSPDIHLNNEEALSLLNLDDFQEEAENDRGDDNRTTLYDTSFASLRSKMTDVTGNGKVMKLVKEKGVGDVVPNGARITINYVGYFEYRDEPFDSSFVRGGSDTFCFREGNLIAGLAIGIATMRKHEKAIFLIHPDLAYGKYGCAPRIPPNEEVAFSVHLMDILDDASADTFNDLSAEEKRLFVNIVQRVQATLNIAKDNFRKQKMKQAIREYRRAVNWIENAELRNDEEEEEANKLLSKAYGNLAVCYNKENMPRRACIACNKVPTPTAKTRFNHGRALLRMGEYNRAMQELQASLRMESNNAETVKEIRLANDLQRKYLDIEKRLWSKCLKAETDESKETSPFEEAAREMCETFARDRRILRQALPDGMTPEEDKYLRVQAAAFGLSVTTHQRYGREVTYLNKPNY